MSDETWKPCSACKSPIGYGAAYYTCSVSTCNRKRTALHFCTVSCWEVHLPVARHREAWAEEQTAPSKAEAARQASAEVSPTKPAPKPAPNRAPQRETRRILPDPKPSASAPPDAPQEVLIIASRLKDYVRAVSGFNTSERVLEPLSKIVRAAVEEAIRNARADERKTILDRDVPKR